MNPVKIPEPGGRKWKNMLLTMGYVAIMTIAVDALLIFMGCREWNIITNFTLLMTALAVGGGGGAFVMGNVGEHKANATTKQAFKNYTGNGK